MLTKYQIEKQQALSENIAKMRIIIQPFGIGELC